MLCDSEGKGAKDAKDASFFGISPLHGESAGMHWRKMSCGNLVGNDLPMRE
jgi:hypothetical protein